jgi:hypothetical protein
MEEANSRSCDYKSRRKRAPIRNNGISVQSSVLGYAALMRLTAAIRPNGPHQSYTWTACQAAWLVIHVLEVMTVGHKLLRAYSQAARQTSLHSSGLLITISQWAQSKRKTLMNCERELIY